MPQIPRTDIIGMRHRLVHAYVDVDHDLLWIIVTEDAPDLLAQINFALETN